MMRSNQTSLSYYLFDIWTIDCDPKSSDLWIIKYGPWPMLAIMSSYLLFVTYLGPKFMRTREPYSLKTPILIYNILMVIVNTWSFYESIKWLNYGKELANFKFPDRTKNSPQLEHQLWALNVYYMSKFVDLLDTIFFVLRKKDRQISLLHLYHHTAVPILGLFHAFNV